MPGILEGLYIGRVCFSPVIGFNKWEGSIVSPWLQPIRLIGCWNYSAGCETRSRLRLKYLLGMAAGEFIRSELPVVLIFWLEWTIFFEFTRVNYGFAYLVARTLFILVNDSFGLSYRVLGNSCGIICIHEEWIITSGSDWYFVDAILSPDVSQTGCSNFSPMGFA